MAQTKISIFSFEDIEHYGKLYGFEYEPNEKLCKLNKIHYHWGSMNIHDGEATAYYRKYTSEYSEEEVKTDIAMNIRFKYVNDIFFLDLKSDASLLEWYISLKSAHLDQWVMVTGHTPLSEDEMYVRKSLRNRRDVQKELEYRIKQKAIETGWKICTHNLHSI